MALVILSLGGLWQVSKRREIGSWIHPRKLIGLDLISKRESDLLVTGIEITYRKSIEIEIRPMGELWGFNTEWMGRRE